ncbi:MAG: CHAD domain-containing protein, partial [Candidatus Poribacteria bacterium]
MVCEADDIEYVHRMRVASRRLRSGFALFEECFPPKRLKRWRKQIRRVTRALGDARYTDVQI